MRLNLRLDTTRLLLLVAMGLASSACKDNGPPERGPGLVRTESPKGGRTPAQPVATADLDSPCRVAHVEWRDRSAPTLAEGTVTIERLKGVVAGELESGEPGWTLFLELAVAPAAEAPGEFHFGVRGFLKDLNQIPPPVLEASAAGERLARSKCGDGGTKSDCHIDLWGEILAQPLQKVMGELSFLCTARQLSGAELIEALSHANSWQRGELARVAGELGDKSVAPALRGLLDGDEIAVQLRAIAALGRLQDDEAIPQLVKLTQGAEETVVRAVMVALADIGSAEARRYLETWAEHHPLLTMRELAGELLGE